LAHRNWGLRSGRRTLFYALPIVLLWRNFMIFTTTPSIEGREVSRYCGVIASEAVIGVNAVRDLFGSVRDVVGGRSPSLEKALQEARDAAFAGLERRAAEAQADAVLSICIEYGTAGAQNGMWFVSVVGTAVQLR
jgi:uncharacterized protein YbjQ (UPF0145 family)